MANNNLTFASFWSGGDLSAYELACLSSVVKHGYELKLFSYQNISNVPDNIQMADAREIVEERYVNGFLIKGKPSLSHFSDLFRYRLFQRTEHIWIDGDMMLLKPLDFSIPPLFIAREDAANLCGAIMRIEGQSAQLSTLVRASEEVAERELVWGETGPRLLTKVFGINQLDEAAFPQDLFYPLHYTELWKAFLPAFTAESEQLCRKAYSVHLWNSVVGHLGIWKRFMPPVGSYLANCFKADGTDRFFEDAYPTQVMRQMIDNWHMRLTGTDLALGQLARQVLPGVRRTLERKRSQLRLQLKRL
jgi:hypothetical protein